MKKLSVIDSLYAYKEQLPLPKEMVEEGSDLLLSIALLVLIVVVQALLIRATFWIFKRWRFKLLRFVMRKSIPLKIKDYEVLNLRKQGMAFLAAYRLFRIFVVLMQLMVSIPMMFYVFPKTKSFAFTIFGYVWNPTKDLFWSVVDYLPNLFQIGVIVVCMHYVVKLLRYFSNEVASGRLKINGFYPDWARPTFLILRFLCYSFMLVMIWPLLPSSNSQVFQGVSVFIGVIVSLGSMSIFGNLMAGIVMTYMRPFRVGDFIKFGDVEGFVVEKTALVTRLRTRKNLLVTIPNSNLMSAQTSNYTASAENYGIIAREIICDYTTVPDTLTDAYLELHPDKKKDLRRIEGFVKDEKGQPLPHAWASISGWSGGAPTDDKGHFVFWTPHKDNTLDVYCDDYHPALKVEIDTQPISISLKHH